MAYKQGNFLVVKYEAVPARKVASKGGGVFEDTALVSDGAFDVTRIAAVINTGRRCRLVYTTTMDEDAGAKTVEHIQTEEPFQDVMRALTGVEPPPGALDAHYRLPGAT